MFGEIGVRALRAVESESCERSLVNQLRGIRGGEGGRGKWQRHTFRIFLALLRCRIGVRVFNARRLPVLDCVLDMGEVEDDGGGCGEDYIAVKRQSSVWHYCN